MGRLFFKTILYSIILICGINIARAQTATKPYADFYVSTAGNDNWSGTLAEPNALKSDGPFATINRAKTAVRLIKKEAYRNIYVLIRGGEYRLKETEKFTPADSHYDTYQIVYMAYPGENPIFSSDIEITGWQLVTSIKNLPSVANGKVYAAPLPALPQGKERFYTLFSSHSIYSALYIISKHHHLQLPLSVFQLQLHLSQDLYLSVIV